MDRLLRRSECRAGINLRRVTYIRINEIMTFERSLRRPDEESEGVPNLAERHRSGSERLLVTADISVVE